MKQILRTVFSILILSCLWLTAHGQIGFNSPAGVSPRLDVEAYTRNGFLVQQKFRFSTADPAATVLALQCPAPGTYSNATAGIIDYPAGPGNYGPGVNCGRRVNGVGSGIPVGYEIVFEELNTEPGGDMVYVTDPSGNTLTFSGTTLPVPFYVAASEFSVQFVSNGNAVAGTGFRLRWRQIYTESAAEITVTPLGHAFLFNAQRGALAAGSINTGLAGYYSTALGNRNTASGANATALGYRNIASEVYATAFGNQNIANGQSATTFGGSNTATAEGSTAFGLRNLSSGIAATAYGRNNVAGRTGATAFGDNNRASQDFTTAFGFNNTASANYSTAFGVENVASGVGSIAAGGGNTASGVWATAIGRASIASGNLSTAAGAFMNTNGKAGAFMIGDSDPLGQGATFVGVNDQFVGRFLEGYYLMTSGDANPGTGFGAVRTGVQIGRGQNSWASISDSTKKERLLPIDHAVLLQKISRMKLTTWNYKGQQHIRHYGPMAQDFYAAFGQDGLGRIGCDTLIYSHDFAGVTFAGVQALIRENEQLKTDIRQLSAQLSDYQARLFLIEKAVLRKRERITYRKPVK